jgi:8-amino-7-oxononanoate synthase
VKQVPRALAHLEPALDELRNKGRLRTRSKPPGAMSFCSNDYLGLAQTPAPTASSGSGASRLIAGERYEHGRLEQRLSEWLGLEQALLFASGYAANVGVIQALVHRDDLVVSDALNHASIIDGLRMVRPQVAVIPHLDAGAVEASLAKPTAGRRWIITESYFSMDADSPDLRALRRLCDAHGAGLIVDEAHALGVLGPDGSGLCAEGGVEPDVFIGTLGKAFGAAGAFAGGCRPLVDWLWNRARSHVFSTGMSPVVAAAAYANVERAHADPSLRERAIRNGDTFRTALRAKGLDVRGHGPIVPWIIGTEADTLHAAAKLRERGVHAVAIRPPTVPEGTSRIRFAFTARHTDEDVQRAVAAILDSFT